MPPLYKKLSESTAARYIFIGGISYLIELSILYIASHIFGLGSVVSVTIGFWLGLLASFLLQKIFAFKDKTISSKKLFHQSITYGLLIVINYFFTIFVVSLLKPVLTLLIARTVALIITTSWNFVIYSKVIFKKVD